MFTYVTPHELMTNLIFPLIISIAPLILQKSFKAIKKNLTKLDN